MEQVQLPKFPVSIHFVDGLQNIQSSVSCGVVGLRLGTCMITPVTSHTHPKFFNKSGD
jgi:hypothetical protein